MNLDRLSELIDAFGVVVDEATEAINQANEKLDKLNREEKERRNKSKTKYE